MEIAILIILAVSVVANVAAIVFALWVMKQTVDHFILSTSDQRTQFLDHVEHLEGLAMQEAKERRDMFELSLLRAEQAQSQPNTTSTTAESEDFGEFGTGNRRMRNGTTV
jgi:hypothetical protein